MPKEDPAACCVGALRPLWVRTGGMCDRRQPTALGGRSMFGVRDVRRMRGRVLPMEESDTC